MPDNSNKSEILNTGSFKPLFTELQIRHRTAQLAGQIAEDYRGKDIVAVIVLKGAFMFAADLLRRLYDMGLNPDVDFIRAASYGDSSKSSSRIEISLDVSSELKDRSVLIMDDIIDTGRTLAHLHEHLAAKGADVIRSCVLLDKPSRREVEFQPDYTGFEIPDVFVVGYGMDYAERYRYLPFITTVEFL